MVTLHPSQQFVSHAWTFSCLLELNQYQADNKVSCSRTHHSASLESQNSDLNRFYSKSTTESFCHHGTSADEQVDDNCCERQVNG